jgi:hypothetical protein
MSVWSKNQVTIKGDGLESVAATINKALTRDNDEFALEFANWGVPDQWLLLPAPLVVSGGVITFRSASPFVPPVAGLEALVKAFLNIEATIQYHMEESYDDGTVVINKDGSEQIAHWVGCYYYPSAGLPIHHWFIECSRETADGIEMAGLKIRGVCGVPVRDIGALIRWARVQGWEMDGDERTGHLVFHRNNAFVGNGERCEWCAKAYTLDEDLFCGGVNIMERRDRLDEDHTDDWYTVVERQQITLLAEEVETLRVAYIDYRLRKLRALPMDGYIPTTPVEGSFLTMLTPEEQATFEIEKWLSEMRTMLESLPRWTRTPLHPTGPELRLLLAELPLSPRWQELRAALANPEWTRRWPIWEEIEKDWRLRKSGEDGVLADDDFL